MCCVSYPAGGPEVARLFGPSYYTEGDLAEEGFRQIGRNVRIARTCTIVGVENISLGDNVRIDGYCTIVAAGRGYLRLGSFIHIAGNTAMLAGEGIEIEDFSTLSWGVKVFTRSDDYSGRYMTNPTVPSQFTKVDEGPVTLGRHVIIGAGSVLLPNICINTGAAVGALSLVNKSLDEWTIYAGVPVKRLRLRERGLMEHERLLLKEVVSKKRVLEEK